MTTAKFTPGPWEMFHTKERTGVCEKLANIAVTSGHDSNRDEGEVIANANLIAAAPEMYEALHALCIAAATSDGVITDEMIENAQAAIAKAQGKEPCKEVV